MADTTSSVVKTWTTGNSYAVKDVVVNSGSYYRCLIAHTAAASFATDSAKWASLGFTPTGTVYSSLEAWVLAMSGATISSGDRHIVDCYAGQDTSSNDYLGINGFTVASGGACIIRAATSADRHNGTWGTGYRFYSPSIYFGVSLGVERITLDGISVRNSSTTTGNSLSGIRLAYDTLDQILLNCRAETFATDSAAIDVRAGGASGQNWRVINCVGVSAGTALIVGGTGVVYNTVGIGGATGVSFDNTAYFIVAMKNSYVSASTCYTVAGASPTLTTCMHSTSQSFSGSTGSITYTTDNGEAMFVSVTPGSEDFHLQSGSALIGAGTDLSGDGTYPFSTDADGVARSSWDVGAYEYVSGAILMGQQWT